MVLQQSGRWAKKQRQSKWCGKIMKNDKKLLRSTVICNMISILLFVVWAQGISQRDYMRIFAWTKLVIYPLAVLCGCFAVYQGILLLIKPDFRFRLHAGIKCLLITVQTLIAIWYVLLVDNFIGPLPLPGAIANAPLLSFSVFQPIEGSIYGLAVIGAIAAYAAVWEAVFLAKRKT